MEGLKQLVSDQEHRQEIVANGLGLYLSGRAFFGAIRTVLLFISPFQTFLSSVIAWGIGRGNSGVVFSFTSAKSIIRFIF